MIFKTYHQKSFNDVGQWFCDSSANRSERLCLHPTMWLMAVIADTNFLKAEVVTGNKVNYVHGDRPTP